MKNRSRKTQPTTKPKDTLKRAGVQSRGKKKKLSSKRKVSNSRKSTAVEQGSPCFVEKQQLNSQKQVYSKTGTETLDSLGHESLPQEDKRHEVGFPSSLTNKTHNLAGTNSPLSSCHSPSVPPASTDNEKGDFLATSSGEPLTTTNVISPVANEQHTEQMLDEGEDGPKQNGTRQKQRRQRYSNSQERTQAELVISRLKVLKQQNDQMRSELQCLQQVWKVLSSERTKIEKLEKRKEEMLKKVQYLYNILPREDHTSWPSLGVEEISSNSGTDSGLILCEEPNEPSLLDSSGVFSSSFLSDFSVNSPHDPFSSSAATSSSTSSTSTSSTSTSSSSLSTTSYSSFSSTSSSSYSSPLNYMEYQHSDSAIPICSDSLSSNNESPALGIASDSCLTLGNSEDHPDESDVNVDMNNSEFIMLMGHNGSADTTNSTNSGSGLLQCRQLVTTSITHGGYGIMDLFGDNFQPQVSGEFKLL